MGRVKREWFDGAVYHVMNRGNNHKDIYLDTEDYKAFLGILAKVQEEYPFTLHAYCLMPNHYHLLIQTKEDEIWTIMHRLGLKYARYFNKKYNFDGPLFRGRYTSRLIKEAGYFLQVSRYIHLNPVKAHMVSNPADYRWSSYRVFVGMEKQSLVKIIPTLKLMEDPALLNYQALVEGEETKQKEEYYWIIRHDMNE